MSLVTGIIVAVIGIIIAAIAGYVGMGNTERLVRILGIVIFVVGIIIIILSLLGGIALGI